MTESVNFPPTVACQNLVTKDVNSSKTIDVDKLVTMVNKARLIVASPRPIIPLASPAIRKIPKIKITDDGSNINS